MAVAPENERQRGIADVRGSGERRALDPEDVVDQAEIEEGAQCELSMIVVTTSWAPVKALRKPGMNP